MYQIFFTIFLIFIYLFIYLFNAITLKFENLGLLNTMKKFKKEFSFGKKFRIIDVNMLSFLLTKFLIKILKKQISVRLPWEEKYLIFSILKSPK